MPPENSSPLTIALKISGDLSATVDSSAEATKNARAQGLTLRDSHGQAVLRYTGLTARDATGRTLAAWLELGQDELRLRVDDATAHYPLVVDPWVQGAKLTASDGATGGLLGYSVGVSNDGSTIVAGAQDAANANGAVYVFVKPGGGWATTSTFTAELTASDGALLDQLGKSVGVSSDGSTIVAAAPTATIGTNSQQGAVYVFARPANGWASTSIFTAKLTASGGAENDALGWSVGLSSDGGTIVAGAPNFDGQYPGAAYVFVKTSDTWVTATETAQLTAWDEATSTEFATSVGVSGDGSTIVAGAIHATIAIRKNQGAGYVFVRPTGGWATTSTSWVKLSASDGIAEDQLGAAAAVSGDGSTIILATLPQVIMGSPSDASAAYVFIKPEGGWVSSGETAKLTTSEEAIFQGVGSSLGVTSDGSTIVAGALGDETGSNPNQGAVYVYVEPTGGWASSTETAKLTAADGAAGDELGASVDITSDATTIVAGAPNAAIGSINQQGAAYVFGGPSASLSATSLSFGNQGVSTTSNPQTVTLTNDGFAPLYVTGVAATSGFSTTTNCVAASPLAANAFCTESITFDPTAAGALSGDLTFTDNSSGVVGSTQPVSLNGTGTVPVVSVGSTITFATGQAVGTTSGIQSLTLTNTGASSLTFTALSVTSEFALDPSSTCAMSPNVPASGSGTNTCTLNLTFTPSGAGTRTGALILTDNNNGVPGSTQAVTLSGTGTAPVVSLSTTGLTFVSQTLGSTSTAQPVTITNTGYANLSIATAMIYGASATDFAKSADGCTGQTLAPNGNCIVSITFAPTASGSRSASLILTDNNNAVANSTQRVSLSGTGQAAAATASITAPSITYNANGVVTVGVTSPSGTVTGNVTLSVDAGTSLIQALTAGSTLFTLDGLTAGAHTISASYAAQGDFAAASATGSLEVNKATTTVTLGNMTQTYTGSVLAPTASTTPSGLGIVWTGAPDTNAGGHPVTATVNDLNYQGSASGTFTINKAAPAVTFTGAPTSAAYESKFAVASSTNAGVAAVISASGACSVAGSTVTMTAATGKCSLTANWVASSNYLAASATQSTTATKATPVINWSPPAAIVYGTALSGTQLDAKAAYNGSSVAGAFTYTPASGAIVSGGSQTLSVTFTPTASTLYAPTMGTVTLKVNPATPEVTWANPTAITYGTALGAAQLDASASVTGSFAYSPAAGAMLRAGTGQPLSCTFTPQNATDYAATTYGVKITVNQAASTIAINAQTPNPSVIGQAVKVSFKVTGGGAGPTGSVTVTANSGETCSGVLSAGAGSCSLTFTQMAWPTLTAKYAGDGNFKGSTSAVVTQTVRQ